MSKVDALGRGVKTRPGICARKRSYKTEAEAIQVALGARVKLRPYRCSLCKNYHLTSRTKGMRSLPSTG